MEILNTKSIVNGESYVVWYDFTLGDDDGIFILHMQGDRKLLKIVKYLKSLNKTMYFCEGLTDVWLNHREPVGVFEDTKQTIFKFVWKKELRCMN